MRAGYNDDDESNVFIPYHQTALAFIYISKRTLITKV